MSCLNILGGQYSDAFFESSLLSSLENLRRFETSISSAVLLENLLGILSKLKWCVVPGNTLRSQIVKATCILGHPNFGLTAGSFFDSTSVIEMADAQNLESLLSEVALFMNRFTQEDSVHFLLCGTHVANKFVEYDRKLVDIVNSFQQFYALAVRYFGAMSPQTYTITSNIHTSPNDDDINIISRVLNGSLPVGGAWDEVKTMCMWRNKIKKNASDVISTGPHIFIKHPYMQKFWLEQFGSRYAVSITEFCAEWRNFDADVLQLATLSLALSNTSLLKNSNKINVSEIGMLVRSLPINGGGALVDGITAKCTTNSIRVMPPRRSLQNLISLPEEKEAIQKSFSSLSWTNICGSR